MGYALSSDPKHWVKVRNLHLWDILLSGSALVGHDDSVMSLAPGTLLLGNALAVDAGSPSPEDTPLSRTSSSGAREGAVQEKTGRTYLSTKLH